MAAEMGDRMAWVMTDLGDRVERLWRMRVDAPASAAPSPATGEPDERAVAELRTVATAMLAEAAPLVRRLEFQSSPAGSVDEAAPRGPVTPPPPEPGFGPGGGGGRRGPYGGGREGQPRWPAGRGAAGVPVVAPGMPRIVIDMPAAAKVTASRARRRARSKACRPKPSTPGGARSSGRSSARPTGRREARCRRRRLRSRHRRSGRPRAPPPPRPCRRSARAAAWSGRNAWSRSHGVRRSSSP